MRILLQQKETGLYLKDLDSWTHDTQDAMDFLDSTQAMDFCKSHNVGGVHLVLKFDEQGCAIVMPLVRSQMQSEESTRDFS